MPVALGNRPGFVNEEKEMGVGVEEGRDLSFYDSWLFWIASALFPQTQTQSNSDHSDACGIVQRWNDDCRVA